MVNLVQPGQSPTPGTPGTPSAASLRAASNIAGSSQQTSPAPSGAVTTVNGQAQPHPVQLGAVLHSPNPLNSVKIFTPDALTGAIPFLSGADKPLEAGTPLSATSTKSPASQVPPGILIRKRSRPADFVAGAIPEYCQRELKSLLQHGVLKKKRLQTLIDELSPNSKLNPDVEDILLQIADDFIEETTQFACKLARHRGSHTLDTPDLQICLERNWNIRVPGFSSDFRPRLKSIPTIAHQAKVSTIKKSIRDAAIINKFHSTAAAAAGVLGQEQTHSAGADGAAAANSSTLATSGLAPPPTPGSVAATPGQTQSSRLVDMVKSSAPTGSSSL
ncbi:transcription initiation factor TFIID subunit A-domain-containing protein [Polychytrium aggregatum]|uniref:transcription initiation factor TFIID subunit A-domain-containing protein n=1 Tax=Polychytrium aggregatum TaxID=110093 RepID=UPI0022FE6BC6|nr:transcription initiation factor TFIID subunit A-domain-containing protein [Polychytrium aggregatum]KAI9193698.1 transcription initiation factor TFIID subunit A-domain-containing protein [Polychytrium aggregatum]